MQKRLLFLLAGLLLVATVSAQCVVPPAGMVSWWRAENDALDSQGSNDGTLQNGATFAAGMVGQAFSLDGADDGVQIATNTFDGLTDIAVDAWVEFNTVNSPSYDGQAIIAARQAGVANYFTFIKFNNPSGLGAAFDNKLYLEIKVGSNVCGYVATANFPFVASQFYHIAVTKSGGTVTFYVDGAQLGSQVTDSNCNGPIASNTGSTFIGRHDGINSRVLNGLIDEVEVFNTALSQSEIESIYNAGSAGKCVAAVPEFSSFTLLLAVLVALGGLFVFRRIK